MSTINVDLMKYEAYEAVSDNGDRNKIPATIVSAIDKYTDRYPERMIYFTGSTEAHETL